MFNFKKIVLVIFFSISLYAEDVYSPIDNLIKNGELYKAKIVFDATIKTNNKHYIDYLYYFESVELLKKQEDIVSVIQKIKNIENKELRYHFLRFAFKNGINKYNFRTIRQVVFDLAKDSNNREANIIKSFYFESVNKIEDALFYMERIKGKKKYDEKRIIELYEKIGMILKKHFASISTTVINNEDVNIVSTKMIDFNFENFYKQVKGDN